jgi:hypothetical protein
MSQLPDHQHAIDALARMVFPAPAPKRTPAHPAAPLDCDDAQLFEVMYRASNGARIRTLASGDDSAHDGDTSKADLVFCDHLASYTQCDAGRMDRMFRSSGRMRAKWDRTDYREKTIQKAIERCTWMYDPGRAQTPPPSAPAPVDTSEEIAALRAEMAGMQARIAYLEDVTETQRTRMQDMHLEMRAYRSHLGADAAVLIEVAREVDRRIATGRTEDDGSVYLPYDAVVTRLVGQDAPDDVRASVKARVTRAVTKADASNLLQKRTEQRFITRDEETGEVFDEPHYRRRTFVQWGTDYATMIESLASVTRPEDAPKRGGWRPRCPHHPTAAVITTHRCSVCNLELKPPPEDPTPPEDTNLHHQEDPAPTGPEDTNLYYIPSTPTVAVNADDTNLYYRDPLPLESDAPAQDMTCHGRYGECSQPGYCAKQGRCQWSAPLPPPSIGDRQ